MIYWLLELIITFILDLITSLGYQNRNKDLEIINLGQQVRILQRKVKATLRKSDPERRFLAILEDGLRFLHGGDKEYTNYYNHSRPHQGISQHFPVSGSERSTKGLIRWQDILVGIIHNYFRHPPAPVSDYG